MKLEEALLRVGNELKKAMTEQLAATGSRVTGDLANSITYEVRQQDYEFQLVRTMLKYGDYVDQGIGRGPGRMPPVKEIMEWIQLKRIPVPSSMTLEAFAFVVARKIGREGTNPRPRPFIAPSINKVLQTTGKKLLTDAGIEQVQSNISGELKSIKIKA